MLPSVEIPWCGEDMGAKARRANSHELAVLFAFVFTAVAPRNRVWVAKQIEGQCILNLLA
jgi:hypothetical protein